MQNSHGLTPSKTSQVDPTGGTPHWSPGGNEGDGGAPRIGGGEGDGGAPRIGGGGGGGGEGAAPLRGGGGDFFLSSPRRTQYHPQGRTCVNGPWHVHVGASVGRRHAGAETPRTTVG